MQRCVHDSRVEHSSSWSGPFKCACMPLLLSFCNKLSHPANATGSFNSLSLLCIWAYLLIYWLMLRAHLMQHADSTVLYFLCAIHEEKTFTSRLICQINCLVVFSSLLIEPMLRPSLLGALMKGDDVGCQLSVLA